LAKAADIALRLLREGRAAHIRGLATNFDSLTDRCTGEPTFETSTDRNLMADYDDAIAYLQRLKGIR
jgi:hypothetical protein